VWRLKPRERSEAMISLVTTTVASARSLPPGERVVIEGIALNAWSAFGDSTLHLADATGAIRAVRVATSAALAGDSVRLFGVMSSSAGQPVVSSASAFVLVRGVGVAEPSLLATAAASSAAGGTRDAALVRVAGTIVAMQPLGTGSLLIVDDGSGPLDVVVGAAIASGNPQLGPGGQLTATGVLAPDGAGSWQLKPRIASDVTVSLSTVTIAAARAQPVGRFVQIEGIALNSWLAFGDSTVHVSDASGSIRVARLPSSAIFAGDSVRIVGAMSVRNGQPLLTGTSAAVLRRGARTVLPTTVPTQSAATAQGGSLDASLLTVQGTVANPITLVAGDVRLPVDDGSGAIRVVLDHDVGFPTGGYRAGMVVRVTGLLVASEDRLRWELKPRSLQDFEVVSEPPPSP
jgi:hypothetical protein